MASSAPTGERLSTSPSTALLPARFFSRLPSDSISATQRMCFSSASALLAVRTTLLWSVQQTAGMRPKTCLRPRVACSCA